MLKLRGTGVPTDVDLYVCKCTFVAVQARVKCLDHPRGLAHEYAVEPASVSPSAKGGVYELQCQRSKHHVQVKVQPALGLAELLPPYSEDATAEDLGVLLERELWPFMGIYYILSGFHLDPNKKSVPLATGYGDSPKHIDWLLADSKMLDKLCAKCPIFSRSYGQPPALGLMDHERPKTRGMLLKAFLEVKMLIIRAVTQIRFAGESLVSEQQFAAFEELMMYIYQDCCAGGVDEQSVSAEESMSSLRLLICGDYGQRVTAKGLPGEPSPVVPEGARGEQRGRLQRLRRALGDAARHLEACGESLGEAVPLAGGQLEAEVSGLAELSGQLKRQLEAADEQLRTLDIANGGRTAADAGEDPKRSRTQ